MKTLTTILLLLAFTVSAQDTTKVINVSMPAKVVEFLVATTPANNPDALNALVKWRTVLRTTKATNTTAVVIDTISTISLGMIYGNALSLPEGYGIAALIKTSIASKRAANSYLNAICKGYEDGIAANLLEIRKRGRDLLLK